MIKKNIRFIILAAFVIISIAATVSAFVYYKKCGMESLKEFAGELGFWGIAFMLFIQICQVVFAIIPGEPVELAMGALYGTWGGLFICLAGCAIGSAAIFSAVGFFGKSFIVSFSEKEKINKLKFLKEPKKRDIFLFLLMFIPGTPKDVLTYFAPLSGISMGKFLIISFAARIPSIISSTYVGATFVKGSRLHSLVVFAIVGIFSIAGLIIYNKIIEIKSEKKLGSEKFNRENR